MRPLYFLFCFLLFGQALCQEQQPNVILIITDDQGYGDLGYTGNPHIKTPTLDQLASESIRFNNFYVSPVCAPTRSSLMTGRYSLRTGIHDTYNGGAIMSTDEITIAEMLNEAGYRTGIFGKWHLGDNYPSRPMDQGFDESVIHLSGGMGQVGDFTTYFQKDRSYFDPVLWHNGEQESYRGYCSDIFTDEAIRFINDNRDTPFFCYLSFNAPHTPLQVPSEYYQLYRNIDPSQGFLYDSIPIPEMSDQDKEAARKIYAMITNIDVNIARVLKTLERRKLLENTIVIFMTDNGPQQRRYTAGLRGLKSSVYRGGVRVPLFVKYPELGINKEINENAAHIDIMPTLAALCNADLPQDRKIDGQSLLPLMQGDMGNFNERSLFFNWTRKYPELYYNVALQRGNYKLVGHTDYDSPITEFDLFDLSNDPFELNNIVAANQELALELKQELDHEYQELISSPNLIDPPRIIVGSEFENPVVLNRNDASGDRGIWAQEEVFGKWHVHIKEGRYNIEFKFIEPITPGGKMILETGTIIHQAENKGETDIIKMDNVMLPELNCDLIPFYTVERKRILPFWVSMEKIE